MSEEASWQPFQGGSTLGMQGSEGGFIAWDQQYGERARLTLEQDDSRSFYAITCSVAGWLVHTCYFGSADEAGAALMQMQPALVELVSQLPEVPSSPEVRRAAGARLAAFAARFP